MKDLSYLESEVKGYILQAVMRDCKEANKQSFVDNWQKYPLLIWALNDHVVLKRGAKTNDFKARLFTEEELAKHFIPAVVREFKVNLETRKEPEFALSNAVSFVLDMRKKAVLVAGARSERSERLAVSA